MKLKFNALLFQIKFHFLHIKFASNIMKNFILLGRRKEAKNSGKKAITWTFSIEKTEKRLSVGNNDKNVRAETNKIEEKVSNANNLKINYIENKYTFSESLNGKSKETTERNFPTNHNGNRSNGEMEKVRTKVKGHDGSHDGFEIREITRNVWGTLVSFRQPFIYSTSNWGSRSAHKHNGELVYRKDCFKNLSDFVPVKVSEVPTAWIEHGMAAEKNNINQNSNKYNNRIYNSESHRNKIYKHHYSISFHHTSNNSNAELMDKNRELSKKNINQFNSVKYFNNEAKEKKYENEKKNENNFLEEKNISARMFQNSLRTNKEQKLEVMVKKAPLRYLLNVPEQPSDIFFYIFSEKFSQLNSSMKIIYKHFLFFPFLKLLYPFTLNICLVIIL